MSEVKFYSKILLFGEYGIIKDSHGLAIPCHHFYGVLRKASSPQEITKDLRLDDFYQYISNSGILAQALDLEKFAKDLEAGLFFDSNIPYGHGIGSSGALCASVYFHYAKGFERKDNYSSDELKYLQDMMALMESYYHGTSSGLDCLISLINLPVIIEGRNKLKVCDFPNLDKLGHFYLFDSHINRKTSPLVHQFLKEYEEDIDFRSKFTSFSNSTNEAIVSLLDGKVEQFTSVLLDLSRWQYMNFSKMIPKKLRDLWLDGLEERKFLVKLCGAGGGGFFLIYSKDKLDIPDIMALN